MGEFELEHCAERGEEDGDEFGGVGDVVGVGEVDCYYLGKVMICMSSVEGRQRCKVKRARFAVHGNSPDNPA